MNNIDIPVSRVFLTALEKDKSKIKNVSPSVIFQRLLSLGERFDYRDVIGALQYAAARHSKLREFQTNFQNSNLVGELMSFDVGPEDQKAWCQFKVIKEPLPGETSESAINFVIVVTDRAEGKQYTRLIGACQRELDKKTGAKLPVFRTISDMIDIVDVEKEIDESHLKPLGGNLEKVIIHRGDKVYFEYVGEDELCIKNAKNGEEITRFADPDVDTVGLESYFMCVMDVPLGLLKHCPVSEIIESFTDTKSPIVKSEPPKVEVKEEVPPPKEEPDPEPEPEEPSSPEASEQDDDEEDAPEVDEPEQETPPAEEPTAPEPEQPSAPAPETPEVTPDEGEPPQTFLFRAGEEVFIEAAGKKVRAKRDITASEYDSVGYPACLTELFEEIEEPKKEETNMNETTQTEDPVIYTEGETIELAPYPGKKFLMKQTVTRSLLDSSEGDLSKFVEEIKEEPKVEAKPVGEIPNQSLVRDEHTPAEYLKMYFNTSSPSIMHVTNKIREEAQQTETLRLTSTYPIETMSIFTDYTFSIIRMKNGCYYRIFVAHTDKGRMERASWLETANEPGRWFKIGDVTDREVDNIMRRRFR